MKSPIHHGSERRSGAIAVQFAVLLVILISVLAIAVDGGMLMSERRRAQATADAAAMAAACVLYENYPGYLQTGTFPITSAQQAAYDVASAAGIDHTAAGTTLTVNIPPSSGPYTNQVLYPGCVEVLLTYPEPRSFSNIFSVFNPAATGDLNVSARAVARGAWTSANAGIIVLNYSGKDTFNTQGNGAFTAVGAPVIVNSNNPSAAYDGGNGSVEAPKYLITGGVAGKTTQFLNTNGAYDPSIIFTGVHPTPDPLAYLPAPGQPGALPIPGAGTITKQSNLGGGTTYTLSPGSFGGNGGPNLPNFTNGDTVIFQQSSVGNNGIYYLVSGGFTNNGANLQLDVNSSGGIMFYNAGTGQNDGINLQGNSSSNVNISPLQNGMYKNIMFFQDRAAGEDVQIAGNGTFNLTGTFYVPNALLKITGNGASSMIGTQYISLDLTLAGNGNISIVYNPILAAPTRILSLVE
jgi:hypothetical protein